MLNKKDTFITIAVDCIRVVGVTASFCMVGRFGRRPLLIYTCFILSAFIIVDAITGHATSLSPILPVILPWVKLWLL
ncbi:uncharacterized protein L203_100636 [Cryptococcus depauperatus CBS 7841]|uniref:Uncharacterized protein n=1 Tax=Cryptococcus depauperatus CBS 7841 TaxID=1295531 RepID=A0AAJ8JNE5_9TREE